MSLRPSSGHLQFNVGQSELVGGYTKLSKTHIFRDREILTITPPKPEGFSGRRPEIGLAVDLLVRLPTNGLIKEPVDSCQLLWDGLGVQVLQRKLPRGSPLSCAGAIARRQD